MIDFFTRADFKRKSFVAPFKGDRGSDRSSALHLELAGDRVGVMADAAFESDQKRKTVGGNHSFFG